MLNTIKNSLLIERSRQALAIIFERAKRLPLKKKILLAFIFLFVLTGEIYNFASYSEAPSSSDSEQLSYSNQTEVTPSPIEISETPSVSPSPNTEKVLGANIETKTTTITKQVLSASIQPVSPTPTPSPLPTSPTPTMGPEAATGTPTPTPVEDKEETGSVSISGVGNFEVEINGQPKTCDVMRKLAREEDLDLTIKHDNNLQTDSIWVINGIGDPNTMWWTYKVNNISPAWGCSHANSPVIKPGDSIQWEYIGPN